MNKNKYVVFGATGSIGSALVKLMAAQEVNCIAVARNLPDASVIKAQSNLVEYVSIDMTAVDEVKQVVPEGAIVFHCANAAYHQWSEKLYSMTNGLLDGLRGKGVHLIYMDNFYAYGDTNKVYSENSSIQPVSKKGNVRADVLELLQAAEDRGEIRLSIVRAGDIYGPNVKNATLGQYVYERILNGKSADFPVPVEEPHCFQYVDDVAKALYIVGSHPEELKRKVWHVPHAGEISIAEWVKTAASQLGNKSVARKMPGLLQSILSLFVPPIKEYGEMQYEYEKPMKVDSSEFSRHFPFTATPHVDAIAKTFDWVKGEKQ